MVGTPAGSKAAWWSVTGYSWDKIKKSLVERGVWTEDGVSRKAKARHCKRCGAVIMAGLDHDRVAMVARCDPAPLNPLGEATALMAGRLTFALRWNGGGYSLDLRSAEQITAHPAGSDPAVEVLAAHACNAPEIAAHLRGELTDRRPTRKADHDQPPF